MIQRISYPGKVNLFPCRTVSVSKVADYTQFQFQAGARALLGVLVAFPEGFRNRNGRIGISNLKAILPARLVFDSSAMGL